MKIKLRPGTPDDANRDYLPESIKGSDIVVNENGNNSQPYPEGLREVTGTLADGVEDRWYEYVPAGYDGTQKVPLVVGVHGGLMTGWGHAIYTSWTLAADRDGFICVFPDAHSQRMWTVEGVFDNWNPNDAPDLPVQLAPKSWQENHDMKFLEALIGRMKETYNIDEALYIFSGWKISHRYLCQGCDSMQKLPAHLGYCALPAPKAESCPGVFPLYRHQMPAFRFR